MPSKQPIPHPSVPLTDAKGIIDNAWYEYFKALGIAGLADVKLTGLANGQVLIWNSATGKWENGAN